MASEEVGGVGLGNTSQPSDQPTRQKKSSGGGLAIVLEVQCKQKDFEEQAEDQATRRNGDIW